MPDQVNQVKSGEWAESLVQAQANNASLVGIFQLWPLVHLCRVLMDGVLEY